MPTIRGGGTASALAGRARQRDFGDSQRLDAMGVHICRGLGHCTGRVSAQDALRWEQRCLPVLVAWTT